MTSEVEVMRVEGGRVEIRAGNIFITFGIRNEQIVALSRTKYAQIGGSSCWVPDELFALAIRRAAAILKQQKIATAP